MFIFSLLICGQLHAQVASILPPAETQFFDANGNPLSSGTVDFYIPSTTTRKTTWQDALETIPNTNPVVLDAAGKALILGSGSYRQVVKDMNGNLIWDQVTTAPLSSGAITLVGDGQAVGSIKPWAGIVAPSQYLFAYGQTVSRMTYAALLATITQTNNVICTSSSPILTGLSDTTQINVGAAVESPCLPGGTIVSSKTVSTVTVNNNSTVTLNSTAIFYPFGNGDGTTTFTLPDLRGYVIAGRDNMGGTAASRLTTTYFGSNTPDATGAIGGSQSFTLLQANLPNLTLTTSIASGQGSHTHTVPLAAQAVMNSGSSNVIEGGGTTTSSAATLPAMTGTTPTGGSGTPISTIQPTITLNYIIKVLPDVSQSTTNVVTSIGGQTGVITCGSGILCTGNSISSSGGGSGTPGGANTQVQFNSSSNFGGSANLTWVSPTLTIGANSSATGILVIAGTTSGTLTQTVQASAGSPVVIWGTNSGSPAVTASSPLAITNSTGNVTCITCATSANNLSFFASTTSAQLFGIVSNPTGSGLLVFNSSPTLVSPTLGAATATSVNGLTLTSSTGTFTLTNAKTFSVANSIALAGIDSSTITFQATDTYVGRATTDTLTNKTYDTAGTGNSFKINGTGITAIGGNTGTVGTTSGALTSGHCVSIDANANFIDAGGACTTGGGGGTVNAGTSGQIAYYGTSSTIVSGNANLTISTGALTVGLAGSVQGSLKLSGVTSGTTTFAVAAAASGTLTFPAVTDTMVGRATTDTLTNKTLTAPVIATITNTGTLTLPTSTDTLVGRATTDTLTNKTYNTAGTGNAFSINGQSITGISGNTNKVATVSGSFTTNDCLAVDANGNVIDNGSGCVSAAGTSGGIPYYNTSTSVASSAALTINAMVLGGGAGAAPYSGLCTSSATAGITCSSATTGRPQHILQNTTSDTNASLFTFQKSRSGGNVQSADVLGNIEFQGFSNSAYNNATQIYSQVAAAPSGSVVPTKIVFNTSGSSLLNQSLTFDNNAHISIGQSSAPTVGTCGTSPSVNGTDTYGQITTGSTATTSCTLTFNTVFANAPFCSVSPVGGANSGLFVIPSTTTMIIQYTSVTNWKFNYICLGA